MGSFSGKKFSATHSTAIDAAVPVIKAVERLDCVSKISLGIIRPIRGGAPGIRKIKIDATSERACIRVTVRGGTSIQELRLYTSNKDELYSVLSGL